MSAITSSPVDARSVPAADLEAELPRLWAEVCRLVEAERGHPPQHTNILTLVAVARGRIEERIARETLDHLSEVQPSRAVLISIDREAADVITGISAKCRSANDAQVHCHEVIELRVPPERLIAVPSLLIPLELFDVPTFVWLVGEVNFDAPEMRMLATFSERVIIDSARFSDALAALPAYSEFLGHSGTSCTGTDLNWARSTSWRELIAQSFDNPTARRLLRGIQNVEIDFDPTAEAQGILLAGWLGSRLDWEPLGAERRGSAIVAHARSAAGGTVTISLNRQLSSGVGLRAVRILASGPSGSARTTIRRRSERLAIVSFETVGVRQERIIPDERPGVPDLVSSELLIHAHDRIFEQALGCAARWLEMIGATA